MLPNVILFKMLNYTLINSRSLNRLFEFVRFSYLYLFEAYQPDFTICHDTNSKHKSLGCVRFARKSYVLSAKSSELVVPPQTAELF